MNSFLFFYTDFGCEGNTPHKITKIDGITVEYTEKNGVCRLVRIHSCDPYHFMRPELSPGADITRLIM